MNNIFKVVWNAASQTWVAVSELQKSKGKTKSMTLSRTKLPVVSVAIASALSLSSAQAAVSTENTAEQYVLNYKVSGTDNSEMQYLIQGVNVSVGNISKSNPLVVYGSDITLGEQWETEGVFIGNNLTAQQQDKVLVGNNINAINMAQAPVTAIGTNITFTDAVTLNDGTYQNRGQSIAIGYNLTGLSSSVIIGQDLTADSAAATVIGTDSHVTGSDSSRATAIGYRVNVSGLNSTAVGNNLTAAGPHDVVVGMAAGTSNSYESIAIGAWTQAAQLGSIAIGNNARALGVEGGEGRNIAIGGYANASGSSVVAIGRAANATGNESIAIGRLARTVDTATEAIAMGRNTNVSGAYSVAIGTGNLVANERTVVLGTNVTTTQDNAVVLGNASTDRAATSETETTLNTITYGGFAGVGSAANSVVSVGATGAERQLINVAAGNISASSTDAINGSQLYSVIANARWVLKHSAVAGEGEDLGGNQEDIHLGDTVEMVAGKNLSVKQEANGTIIYATQDNLNVTSIYNGNTTITLGDNVVNMGDNKVTGVAPADLTPDSTDAVNGSQLYQTNQNVTNLTNAYANTTVNGDNNINVETVTNADGSKEFNLSLGPVVSVGDANPVTIDGENGTVGGLTNKTFDPDNIVSGQAATEDQLKQAYDQLGGDITNVAGDVANLATNVTNLEGDVTNLSETVAKGLNFDANQGDVVNKQLGETLTIKGGLANDAVASDVNTRVDIVNGELIVKIAENPTFANVTANEVKVGDTTINNDGMTINNGPSITKSGIDVAGNKITNVAAGEDDSDAVNVAQLKEMLANTSGTNFKLAVGDALEGGEVGTSKLSTPDSDTIVNNDVLTLTPGNNVKLTATDKGFEIATKDDIEQTSVTVRGERGADGAQGPAGVTITAADGVGVIGVNGKDGASADITVAQGPAGLDGNDGANGTTKTRIQYQKADGTTENVATMNDGLHFVGDDGQVVSKKLNETLGIKGATTKGSNGQDVKNISVNKSSDGNLEVQLAKDIDLGADGSVRMGNTTINNNGLSITNGPSVTSSGINAGGQRITNVAAGVNGTDAVNLNQLQGAIGDVHNRMNSMDKDLRAGIAGATATAGLYHATLPGKSMFSGGAGTYKGQSAVAMGYSRLSDNGKYGIKMTVNTNSRGDTGASASFGIQW